jgi:hypothetical protein
LYHLVHSGFFGLEHVMERVFLHRLNGLPLRTGDIICTQDGVDCGRLGAFWKQLGRVIPGEVDHCLVYLGPGGRCIESALKGVAVFEMPGPVWDSEPLCSQRSFSDTLVGIAYPLAGLDLSAEEEARIRSGVADYCLQQFKAHKPYNFNFFNPSTERAFYCSHLVYKAYQKYGIDLNTNQGVWKGRFFDRVIFPEEIWNACPHLRVSAQDSNPAGRDSP